ncbi:acetyltransferase [Chlorobaculum thiosulfatiphilum]|uniref:Acetyltransferase n=1 Tax=Chlorobaculum thiosulfatiphilum TaxID=115852 RepID=A0A5C4S542_CHLTI|nr:acetyltransferase [Chlorobaculum thiosulfatiphilum]TNJ38564.1 acetyltransferase [Chlorobaculum thiosulfatiphilum]
MKKSCRLALLGASGHGKVVADAALLDGWREVDFFDDAWPDVSCVGPWPVIGNSQSLIEQLSTYDGVVVAIGDNSIRLQKLTLFQEIGLPLVTIIHPSSVISQYGRIGKGTVVFAGAIINPFAEIGCGSIINTAATIDHDCKIADGVHVSPGAHLGGGVQVGKSTWIGLGASVKQCIRIGENSIVGMGAVVVRDVPSGVTVVGVPAREMRI